MKLVLLPGMDGTGILFKRLLPYIQDFEVLVLPLPDVGSQDYKSLSEGIWKLLPCEDFIMVAESFSGGIAALLSQEAMPQLKGIIFVASFLSAPKKIMATFSSLLPLRMLMHLPLTGVVYRHFFLGEKAGKEDIELFKSAIKAASTKALQLRLKVIAQSTYDGFQSSVPVVYISADQDKLVHLAKRQDFVQAYADIEFLQLAGPHFILQAKPKESAAAIVKAVGILTREG